MTYLTLDEIHREELAMLCGAGEWFKANGIRYSLAYGTLLGAVRHQGFIPWDDDVDIHMPRPDYERWLSMADAFRTETGFGMSSCRDGSFQYPFSKITNPAIRAQEACVESSYERCLWIDVFPVDGVPDDGKEHERLLRYRHLRFELINLTFIKGSKNPAKAAFKTVFQPLFRLLVDPVRLANDIDGLCRRVPFEASRHVYNTVHDLGVVRRSVPREGFEETVTLPFCGTMQPCMSCWDEYLTNQYGDYMTLPPEGERRDHGIKAWRVG